MPRRKVGHAANAKLKGEWGKHVRPWWKRYTSGVRKENDKAVIRDEINNVDAAVSHAYADYIDDKELTDFGSLDAEPFYETE